MSNLWTIVENDEQLVKLGPTDGREPAETASETTYQQCPARLSSHRCILKIGHEGNHAADMRK
jgi:hypothetical protein